jgi:membrane-associated phospholipid phosphatase
MKRYALAAGFIAVIVGSASVRAQDLFSTPLPDTQNSIVEFKAAIDNTADHDSTPLAEAVEPPAQQQPAAASPPPAHTGFKALLFETASDFKAFPLRKSTWVILGAGGAAAALGHLADDDLNSRLAGDTAGKIFKPGRYIGSAWFQAGVAGTIYVVGRYFKEPDQGSRTNRWSHLGFDLLRGLIVSQAFTQGIKYAVQRDRPTGECCAFPSGHATSTFATASILERHFGYRGAWPTILIATYVSASRLHENRHFLSDVLFGAALGTATGWTVVGRHGRSSFALVPEMTRGGVMVALRRTRASTQPTN